MKKDLVLCLVLILSLSCSYGKCDNSIEIAILLSFKRQYVSSDPQNALGGWNSSSPLCTWPGISCSKDQSRVHAIRLPSLSLSGIISPHISNLSSLRLLDLSYNYFHGSLPEQLGRLSHLRKLLLNHNSLTGSIPSSLSHCLNLQELFLSVNHLSGHLPPSLGSVPILKFLVVSSNYLVGSIPSSVANLTSLAFFYLANNQLSGDIPEELGSLKKLIHLQISNNQLTGTIPRSVYNISSLEFLSVTKNNLTGQLPQDIGRQLTQLTELDMSVNKFSGPIPSSLSNISGIRQLYLSENHFHGPIPLLGNMRDLIKFNLEENSLSSNTNLNLDFFNSLTNCTHLELFCLRANNLAGQLPTSIANLSIHLQGFHVDNNQLSGPLPQGMHSYPNLMALDLSQNSFTGGVPESVGLLANMQILLLSGNRFVGYIPDLFGNLTELYELNLSHNQFYGGIPDSIGNLGHLELLDLSSNNLTGPIPRTILNPQSSTLRFINLANNSLNSSLPADLGQLNVLEFMDLSDNKLSGSIPNSLGGCSSLQGLRMARNWFRGSIPESFSQLLVLERLDLSTNVLSGHIPGCLGKLKFLSSLNLSFNDLQGKVPGDGVFMNISHESLQGNKGLCSDDGVAQKMLSLSICNEQRSSSLALKVVVPISCFVVLLSAMLCLVHKQRMREMMGILGLPSSEVSFTRLSFEDILAATDNFSSSNLLGKGCFGSVYMGVTNGVAVAIKVLDLKQQRASVRFASECKVLQNIRHPNIIKIITICSSIDSNGTDFKALIMELMSNGSLDNWLHPETPSSPRLGLLQRLKISIDVAAAMDHLHHDCDPPIIHSDLKPSNVLLDDEMTAHVGDFGLARFLHWNLPMEKQSSELRGSVGYIAPECGLGSKPSTAADVYNYGVLLLETFTGKKPEDDLFKDGLNLNKFATAVVENRLEEIVDPRLLEKDKINELSQERDNSSRYRKNNTSRSIQDESACLNEVEGGWLSRKEECLSSVIRIGLWCSADAPVHRPSMRETLMRMRKVKEMLLRGQQRSSTSDTLYLDDDRVLV